LEDGFHCRNGGRSLTIILIVPKLNRLLRDYHTLALTRRWWLIATLGGVTIIEVLRNVVFAIGDPLSLNIGHLGGLIVGLLFGYYYST
jgi:membrane associated rhomboid family serine protease